MHLFDHLQAANARTQHAADPVGQFIVQRRTCGKTSVGNCLTGRCNAEMDERVHGARLFGAHVGLQVEAFDFTGNLAGESGGVEFGDRANTGLTGQDMVPSLRYRIAYGTNATQTSDNNATTGH